MKKAMATMSLLLLTAGTALGIDVPGGDIPYGTTWEVTSEPYHIQGDINVLGLTIRPGVEVLFDGNYRFDVNGVLTATGAPGDSILFAAAPENSAGWSGLEFNLITPVSELAYCIVRDAVSSGIRINNCRPLIHNCLIEDNSAVEGGGIRITLDSPSFNGTASIVQCTIRNNYASTSGGGVRAVLNEGSLTLTDCAISGNQVNNPGVTGNAVGAGMYASTQSDMSLSIIRCAINDNDGYANAGAANSTRTARGGGLFLSGGNNIIAGTEISHNRVYATRQGANFYNYGHAYGGGVYFSGGTLAMNNSIIRDNYYTASNSAAGIGVYVEAGTVDISNSTVIRNTLHGIHRAGGVVTTRNSIYYFNSGDDISGTVTVDYCDVENVIMDGTGNISINPTLDTTDMIQWPSSCINAGDPDPSFNDVCFPPSVAPLPGDPWDPMYRNDMGWGGGPGACELIDAPSPPRNLTVRAETDRIVLAWRASETGAVDRYRIYRSIVAGAENPAAYDSVAAGMHTYNDISAAIGTRYYYRLKGVTADGQASAFSNEVCATPGDVEAPTAPATPTAEPGDRIITIAWATQQDIVSCDVVAYVINCTPAGGTAAAIDTIPSLPTASHSYTDSVPNYIEHCYTVQALDNAGLLSLSSAASCATAEGPRADLHLTKLVSSSVPDIGAEVTFTLELTNDGPDPTVNAVVTDLLPEGLTFVSASSADYGALTGEWLVGVLDEGATATLELVATVDAAGDTIRNTATVVDDGTTDLDTADNEATAWILGRACDLRLVKTVDHDDPSVGDEIVFKVVVANLGPDTATGVEVLDALQPGLTYLRVFKSTGTYIGERWRIGSMAAGRTDSLMIYARVDEPGVVTNSATATAASPPDLDPSNNVDSATVTGRSADLVLTMFADPIGPEIGEPVTITVTIHNDGPSAADDVTVIDAIPAGLIGLVHDAPPGTAYADSTWNIGHLSVSQSLSLVFTAEMNTEDPVTNTARIASASLSDPDPNNNAAFVTLSTDPADLWVNKFVDRPAVSVGDTVTFTVVLGNEGPSAAAGIRLLDSAAPGLTFVSADASHGAYAMGNGVWSVASLAAGATDTLLIRAVVDQALTIENTATLIGALQADPVQGNNSVSAEVTGLSADLALIAMVSGSYNPRPAVGEIVTLNMLVRNIGPSTAEMVRVNAPLPAQLELQGTVPNDGSYDYVSGHWDVGTLAPGASRNMALSVEVLAAEPMRFSCNLDSSSVPDPWGNNDASEITFYMVDADLAIDKTVSEATPAVNTNVTYTLTVTNNGPDDVSEVTVGDTLPAEVTFVSATASTGSYTGGVWTVGDLADGISETLAIVVTVDELGEITNVAQITGSTGRDDDLSDNSDFVDMHPIDPAPTIVIGGPYGVTAGVPVTVTAVASDNTGVTDATLHYRAGNATAFTSAAMTPGIGADVWQGVIPGDVTGHRGVACYVSARDAAGGEGFSGLAAVTVDVAEITNSQTQPGGTTQSAYRMIAVPLDLDDPDPASVLEDDLGPYDRDKWRLFSLNATQIWSNAEFPNCGSMTPGRGFFLIVGEAGHVIDAGPGTTVPLDRPFAVNLHAGWNLVGNPFNFDVPMANLTIESIRALDVRDYQGSWGIMSGTSNLAPFRGYLVAAAADNDRLLIDPVGDMNKRLPLEEPVPAWELGLTATVGEARDDDNTVSVYEGAADGLDRFDRPEPPALGGYVSVSFPHGDWEGPFKHFCKDARPVTAEGWTWELEVRTNVEGLVTLDWDGLESLPDDRQVWLRDELLMINVDLREAADYSFVGAHESQSARSFRLVVGSGDYIAAALPASESIPVVLTLKSNFPNPFNPSTTIRYGVPREGRVELGVYDVRGRLVARLIDEVKPAGYHAVVWEGRNAAGEGVASGTYLCRIIAGGEVRTEKMLLIK
jgi:uncharacterized repeat protein (TIGR01451 family)